MYPVVFEIGPITIYSRGIFWVLGALAAVWILQLELKRHGHDTELAGTIVMSAERLQSLIVFAILWGFRKRNFAPGTIFSLYLVLAGSMRFIVQFWHANPVIVFGFTEYQSTSGALIAIGASILLCQPNRLLREGIANAN